MRGRHSTRVIKVDARRDAAWKVGEGPVMVAVELLVN